MITYPVDVQNTRWALWSIGGADIIKHNMAWPRADGAEIVDLNPDLVPLLEVKGAQPAYDPAIERLQRSTPVVDVAGNTHTHGWEVVAIPQGELDDAAELVVVKALYLDLKNHVGTTGERATRLENVVARIMKDMYQP